MTWREHQFATPDGVLAWFEAGSGDPVIMINGGPGDDHRYLRVLADPLLDHHQCVLYDQRGTGASRLRNVTAQTVHVDRLCDDLDALRSLAGVDRATLVGHSWGAMLALAYGTRYPQRVARLALLAPGPLRPELDAVCAANLRLRLSASDRAAYDDLNARRRAARAAADVDTQRSLHLELMDRFVADRWIYHPEVAERFRADYRAASGYQPLVNQLVNASVDRDQLWQHLTRITAPALVIYGYQDFEPITQAYLLRERLPQLEICLLNECGHIPWLDQPAAVQGILSRFLAGE
jgi:proline iminopeptidase